METLWINFDTGEEIIGAVEDDMVDLRSLGDLPGHPFHGNQWTSGHGTEKWTKKDADEGAVLNGVPMHTESHPNFALSVNPRIQEPPLLKPKHSTYTDKDQTGHLFQKPKHVAAGLVVTEPDGRVWVVEPAGRYGGYRSTFPKGTVDPNEPMQWAAAREMWEETGLVARVTGHLTDVERTTSVTRFYTAERIGGAPWAAGPETHAVKLIPIEGRGTENALRSILGGKTSDHQVLDTLRQRVRSRALGDVEGHPFHGNQWTDGVASGRASIKHQVVGEDTEYELSLRGKDELRYEQVKKHFGAIDGFDTTVTYTPWNHGVEISGAAKDENGKFHVSLAEEDGNLHVISIHVDESIRDRPVTQTLLRQMDSYMEDAKIDRATFYAGLTMGGYAWAKLGGKTEHPEGLADRLMSELDYSQSRLADLPMDRLTGLTTDQASAVIRVLQNNRSNKSLPQVIASFRYQGKLLGPKLLRGAEWEGYIDRKDKESTQRFNRLVYHRRAA